MPHPYSRAKRARQDIVAIITNGLHGYLDGHGLDITEINEAVETRIDEEVNAAVRDAISEIRPNDE